MLTARDQLDDRLQGFRSGADDYLVKPFALSELSARIEAVLRRAQGGGRRELSVADLSYDLDTLEVKRAGKSLKLNPIGLKLLAVLMQKSPMWCAGMPWKKRSGATTARTATACAATSINSVR